MTAPRQVLPGTTYLVTRRCARRQLFLRPSRAINGIFLYVLALAAQRYGVKVHAFCVLSNHYHLVVTDPNAQLPEFGQYLDSLVARAVNCALRRWEHFWAPNSYSAVTLATPHDILDKATYALANPVAARLVRRAQQWPGQWSDPEWIGGAALQAPRPKLFFSRKSYLPATASLELVPPPGFESAGEFRRALAAAVTAREVEAAAFGREFLGVAKVLSQKPTARPASHEPRRALNPRVAAHDKWKRIEMLSTLLSFLREYRDAWLARRQGKANVVFPPGTYMLRVMHGVSCAPCV